MPIEVESQLLLTRKETAALLRRCTTTLRRYEIMGLLNPIRFADGHPLYRAEEVEAIMRGRR